jgi:hypothetical protein
MKMLATACCVLGGGMLFSRAAQGTSTTPKPSKFKIETSIAIVLNLREPRVLRRNPGKSRGISHRGHFGKSAE